MRKSSPCIYLVAVIVLLNLCGCGKKQQAETIIVYCGVDEPYASQVFADFEKQTGLHVTAEYDIESSRSVGMAGKLEAERDHPRADVWWSGEPFLSVRLADEGILTPYQSPAAGDILPKYKDDAGYWAGVGLRARVLAVGKPPPPFEVKSIQDLADPRLKDKIAMSRPTAGAAAAHLAALYVLWGPDKAREFFRKLHDNGIALLGGNSEVADQVGAGVYTLGLTDNDDIANTAANGGKITMVIPDQNDGGTLALPSTVGLVKGTTHEENAKKLIDFLLSQQVEQKLIDLKFSRWSVRGGSDSLKAMDVDYKLAAKMFPLAQREATAILEGRKPE